MERADWSRLAHAGMTIMNPLPSEKLDEAIEAMGYVNGSMAIDLGCGKGELLRRLEPSYVQGVGVDTSAELLAEAREHSDFEFVQADATTYQTAQVFHIAASIGGPVTLERLAGFVGGGGYVLYGDGYWRQPPSAAYLDALGATEDELADYAGTIRIGEELGLTPLYAVTATVEEFDRYEWRWSLNGERYAAEHPDEPGVGDFLGWIRNGRRRYLELGGRDTLGFGLFLFRR
jgi:SAM-dependent methyltransferase